MLFARTAWRPSHSVDNSRLQARLCGRRSNKTVQLVSLQDLVSWLTDHNVVELACLAFGKDTLLSLLKLKSARSMKNLFSLAAQPPRSGCPSPNHVQRGHDLCAWA